MHIETIKFIQKFQTPLLDKLFQIVTRAGESSFFVLLFVLLFWCIDKKFAYKLGISYITNGLINISLKETFKIPRPIGEPGVQSFYTETAKGYSFPSGHSQATSSVVTSVMTQLRRKWGYVVGVIIILSVALSRIYIGVHTLVDVVAGVLIGVLWVLISNKIFNYIDSSHRKSLMLLYLVPVALSMFFFRTSTFYKRAGILTSLIMGYTLDSAYMDYDVKTSLWKQIVKYTIGLSGLIFLQKHLKSLLPSCLCGIFFRYFITGIWIFALSPLLFRILRLNEDHIKHI